MPSPRHTKTTNSVGIIHGAAFDDKTVIRNIDTAVIRRIIVTHDNHVRSITVHYADVVGVMHGTVAGISSELTLALGEFITRIEGTFVGNLFPKIEFWTSKGKKWGPFGLASAIRTFVWDGFGPGMGLLYLSGNSDGWLRSLKGTFGMHREQPLGVKYEKHVAHEAVTKFGSPRSVFTSVLTSSTVTLVIGADKTKLNVSQEILCRLPFFGAALKGKFREASEQTVNMPDDTLQDVTALVEFLYKDRYTYPYYEDAESGSTSPVPDLAEGLYHVGVYATAHKYGCPELETAALDLFMYVLEHLQGIEVVRLWKGAYGMDLLLEMVEDNERMETFRCVLPGLLKELYSEHRTEMEAAAAEYPLLWSDFLRLVLAQ